MKTDDVQHLARLARIAITDTEAAQFTQEIDDILQYVSEVQAVAGTDAVTPTVGPVYNVFRADVVTTEPEQYTDTLLQAMPETDGRFMKVPKILKQDD
ncbi:MAG TPA: Asp-tRNA(Asn)/Glu-tRNA(Gln) amidotransferase subunit GatC [Candidatus Paceibacterota bacterium]|nr:Asp-tRNA(Asn)/Glu-tRNA(Gln) amidotransferase subunit GatC [Candidatus Paceibacterota bacterium]